MRNNKINVFQRNTTINLMDLYGIYDLRKNCINLNNIFNNSNYNILEIGFGNGENLVNMAIQYPNFNFVGVEIYEKGISKILKKIHLYKLKNIRIIYKNAYKIISNIKKNSIYGIHILFPDPWQKIKHYKRRLLNLNFIKILCKILLINGFIHIATDIKMYAKLICNNFYFKKNIFTNIRSINNSIVSKRTKFQVKNKKKSFMK